jgi:hypothetical protein
MKMNLPKKLAHAAFQQIFNLQSSIFNSGLSGLGLLSMNLLAIAREAAGSHHNCIVKGSSIRDELPLRI